MRNNSTRLPPSAFNTSHDHLSGFNRQHRARVLLLLEISHDPEAGRRCATDTRDFDPLRAPQYWLHVAVCRTDVLYFGSDGFVESAAPQHGQWHFDYGFCAHRLFHDSSLAQYARALCRSNRPQCLPALSPSGETDGRLPQPPHFGSGGWHDFIYHSIHNLHINRFG